MVDFASTGGKTYEFQLWISTTGTTSGDFTNAFPTSGNLVSNSISNFKSFILPTVISGVKYVKLIGYGQSSGSEWNTIKEIEFYKTQSLYVDDVQELNTLIYPIPANNFLSLSNFNTNVNSVRIISLEGKIITTQKVDSSQSKLTIDTSKFANGLYIVHLLNSKKKKQSKMIIIQH